jgi:UPF0271 protein
MHSIDKKVIVLDTSAFIMGYDPLKVATDHYTVPKVLEELAPETTIWLRFKISLETGKIRLQVPSQKSLKTIDENSTMTGDASTLSSADRQVLALSLELRESGLNPLIVSDDYAIQNTADQLGLKYTSLSTFGISRQFKWILYCPACGKKYQMGATKICRICGTSLKRKALKKWPVKKRRFTF